MLKQVLLLFLLTSFTLVLAGCKKEEKPLNTIKPIITIDANNHKVTVKIGEEIDLMAGVRGLDDVEGDITYKVEYSSLNLDLNTPGEYQVYFYLADESGNQADYQMKTVIVTEPDVSVGITDYPVYTQPLAGEKCPVATSCYPGAWYHKVVSSKDAWIGLVGTITLPMFNPDPARDTGSRYLDNPSIYMGGNAGSESDVGLSLSLVSLNHGSSISSYSVAFRPFWRYITSINKDEGGYAVHDNKYAVSCNGNNCFANWHYRDTQFYYLPGDKIKMMVYSPKANYLKLLIEVLEVSTLPSSISLRNTNGWSDPADFESPMFYSAGHSVVNAEFKRVNAIDQVNNENQPTKATQASVIDAGWESSYLLRKLDGIIYRVPFTPSRSFILNCPNEEAFEITKSAAQSENGGETLNIKPGKVSQLSQTPLAMPKKKEY
jgi:hypothetical protein